MKKILFALGCVVLMSCGGNSTKTVALTDSIAVDTTVVDTTAVDTVFVNSVDSIN